MAEKNPQNNAKYWEKRIAQKTWSAYNDLEEKNRFLLEFYQDASKNIREEIYEIAEKYSKDGTLSRTDMYRFNHYDNLDKKIQKEIEELGKKQFELTSEEMKNGFRQVYENVSVELGEPDFTMLDKKLMEELLDRPWRGDSFSKRTWKNLKRLAAALNDQLLTGLQQGKTATGIAISLNNIMGQGFNAAHRLVRTETMHYLNQAALQSYKDRGVEHVQFCAAADERTCPECGRRHRKIYELEKALILPIHPNCRCTYLPVVEDIPTMDLSSKDTVEYSEAEIKEIAKRTQEIVERHIKKKTKWSGNIIVNPENGLYGKLWNCDISTMRETAPHIILHEQLHAVSISYHDVDTYLEYYNIEEASVQFMAQEISKAEGIGIIGSQYDDMADALREINQHIGFADSDYGFAKMLMEIPVTERLDFIQKGISDIMDKKGTVEEYMRMSELFSLLEV